MFSGYRLDIKKPTLREQTRELLAGYLRKLPERDRRTLVDRLQRIYESSSVDQARRVEGRAPDFTLPGTSGGTMRLYDELQKGPVVLTFSRGGWCEFCSSELFAIEALGGRVLAISPENIREARRTAIRNRIRFPLLREEDNRVAREYGLTFDIHRHMREVSQELGRDRPPDNVDQSLPVPATYVVDSDGVIRSAFLEYDHGVRMEPKDVGAALRERSNVRSGHIPASSSTSRRSEATFSGIASVAREVKLSE